jgi:head-tail adaptor
MIPAAELTAMQAAANSAMDQSITIQRDTQGQDATGHPVDNWATVTTVMGNLAQPSGTLMQNYDYLIGSQDTWMVRVPTGTNVLENDRLVIGAQTMRVQVLLAPQSYQTSMRLLASVIR